MNASSEFDCQKIVGYRIDNTFYSKEEVDASDVLSGKIDSVVCENNAEPEQTQALPSLPASRLTRVPFPAIPL